MMKRRVHLATTEIEIFVTVHDSSIVAQCEREKRFAGTNHTYLFVGPRPVDEVGDVKLVRCFDYLPNYEHLPHFYDFTGWFVLAKHGLIKSNHAIFLQYDHSICDTEIETKTKEALKINPMVGFAPASYDLWTLLLPGFYEKQIEGIMACGDNWETLLQGSPFDIWPTTQGTAWRTKEFKQFMMWFEPSFEIFKDETFAGHFAERMIQPFLMRNGWTAGFLPGLVSHESADCHGTKDLIMGNMDSYHHKTSVFGR